ncbi:Factor arrest protein 11 [Thoreauomyces humboldtii]|nr:Factor arrest protein 11 [Thoreauomyces humboldtii]
MAFTMVRPTMVTERKPLSLPPPIVFAPRPVHTTLQNARPPSLPIMPPTPPPPPFDPSAPLPTLDDLRTRLQNASTKALAGLGTRGSSGAAVDSSSGSKEPESQPRKPPPVDVRPPGATHSKKAAYDFVYADRDTFKNETNEFYNFQDRPQIMNGKVLFESSFKGSWKSATASYRAGYIGNLLEQMELRDSEYRYMAVQKLLYICHGVFGEVANEDEHIESMFANNKLVFQMGALDYVFAALKVASITVDAITRATEPQLPLSDRQAVMELANSEITAYMCILGLMIEVNSDDEEFALEVTNTSPPMASYLFTLVQQLAEGNRKHYPVKKLLLLLWKVLLISLGNTQQLMDLKSASRTLEGLPDFDETILVKSTPQDYHNFHLVAATRYPAYVTPNASALCPSRLQLAEPIPTSIRRHLQQPPVIQPFISTARTLPTTFQESVKLYRKHNYISLASVQITREKDRAEKEEAHKNLLGGNDAGNFPPDVMDDDVTAASQLGSERRRDVVAMRPSVKKNAKRIKKKDAAGLKRLETLYRCLLPNMSTHIGMLIRLLYYVNLGTSNANAPGVGGKPETEGEHKSSSPTEEPHSNDDTPFSSLSSDEKKVHLLRADNNRHKEVVTKAVSGILLILLKASKCHHALKSEYVSQLLVDNNCAILILKMLSTWLQSPALPSPTHAATPVVPDATMGWADASTKPAPAPPAAANLGMGAKWLVNLDEPEELNFFHFCHAADPFSVEPEVDTGSSAHPSSSVNSIALGDIKSPASADTETSDMTTSPFTHSLPSLPLTTDDTSSQQPPLTHIRSSFRNFYTSINLLRILQKLTKRKTHRVLALVQWKASAVLKRAIKVNHVGLQLYALKLLKSQIPYLGKKWRSSNMKVITAIFLHLRPCLRDEYLAGDVDVDVDEALAHEQKLRSLIASYHEHRYPEVIGTDVPNHAPATASSGSAKDDGSEDNAQHQPDELDLIISISRRASYEGATDPQIGLVGPATGNRRMHPDLEEHLALDPNFMENYEEWLHLEVYGADPVSPTAAWDGVATDDGSNGHAWESGSAVTGTGSGDAVTQPRSLFSATRRFSKEMISDEYDDTNNFTWDSSRPDSSDDEFGSDDDDDDPAVSREGTYASMWDEPVDFSRTDNPDDDPTGRWAWTRTDDYETEDYAWKEERDDGEDARSKDSGIGSWDGEDGEAADGRGSAATTEIPDWLNDDGTYDVDLDSLNKGRSSYYA